LETAVIVLDILLFCNLLLFAVCAFRAPRAGPSRIDDLVEQATKGRAPATFAAAPRPLPASRDGDNVVPFPSPAEIARRRSKAVHPSVVLRHHPGLG
jgi:hypothetical protein